MCKKITQNAMELSVKTIEIKKYGCLLTASESKSENWLNARQQLFLIAFYREPDLIEDGVMRKLLETVKSKNFAKAIICTSTGFTRTSIDFCENRPIELIGKERLEELLNKAKI